MLAFLMDNHLRFEGTLGKWGAHWGQLFFSYNGNVENSGKEDVFGCSGRAGVIAHGLSQWFPVWSLQQQYQEEASPGNLLEM